MFTLAKPVWIKNRADDLNLQAAFTCTVEGRPDLILHLTAPPTTASL